MTDSQTSIQKLRQHIQSKIIGQSRLVDRMLCALLADGHLLVEGAPGLAKTTAIKALTEAIKADFHRIQFTPDLLPADLIGTEIFRQEQGLFEFQQGPLFHNLVLADEINRAPAKVQSALLEAMAERQVTVGSKTYPLEKLFLVMATQNPLEQEGTYPLPEAQMDRFLLHVEIDYPSAAEEMQILALSRSGTQDDAPAEKISQADIFAARQAAMQLHCSEAVDEYMVQLVLATRSPEKYQTTLANRIQCGASPRATIALDRCAKAHAWLQGREYVSPADVQEVAPDVLRHRLIMSFEAEADDYSSSDFIHELLRLVPVA